MTRPTDVRRLALSVLLPGFEGSSLPRWLDHRLAEGLAGVCLFGQNVVDDAQVRTLTASVRAVRADALVASDEEGGSVTRLDVTGSRWPGHATLGALDDEQATYDVAAGIGLHARSVGVDLVLAPVLDVNSEADNPVIGVRSFGADPALVARHGAAFVRGLQDAGVTACVKHFPGHGATRTDSHLDLPVVDVDPDTWRRRDLAPFAAAVEAGVGCVMTAHVVVASMDPEPATMSPRLLGLLREELGFDGVMVSDALDMRAISDRVGRGPGAVRALAAGVDLLCIGNPVFPDPYDDESAVEEILEAVQKAVADGSLPLERLQDASRRVAGLARPGGPAPTAPVDRADQLRRGVAVARRALQVRGDVRLTGGPVRVVVPRTQLGYAAGRRPSDLVTELRRRRPDWPVLEVVAAEPAALTQIEEGADGVLVVVEGRPDAAVAGTVRSVLDRVPGAVVVHGGLRRPDDAGDRTVHTHGTGTAVAVAVADLLLGEEPR